MLNRNQIFVEMMMKNRIGRGSPTNCLLEKFSEQSYDVSKLLRTLQSKQGN